MRLFHVNKIWRKKEDKPMKRINGVEPKEASSSSSSKIKPLLNWEDMFLQRMEKMRQEDQRRSHDEYLPNPYRHNIWSYYKPHLSSSPLKPKKVRQDEIHDKIYQLEKVSKACVETIGKAIDSYWMMSKDLEKKVDDIDGRVGFLIKTIFELRWEEIHQEENIEDPIRHGRAQHSLCKHS